MQIVAFPGILHRDCDHDRCDCGCGCGYDCGCDFDFECDEKMPLLAVTSLL